VKKASTKNLCSNHGYSLPEKLLPITGLLSQLLTQQTLANTKETVSVAFQGLTSQAVMLMMKVQEFRSSTRIAVVTVRHLHTQGCGVFGALGHGNDLLDTPSFRRLQLSGSAQCSIDVKCISAGWGHSAIVTQNGQLVIFGRPYDDVTIKAINRIKSVSQSLARLYGIIGL
jgi:hypothetical protein